MWLWRRVAEVNLFPQAEQQRVEEAEPGGVEEEAEPGGDEEEEA